MTLQNGIPTIPMDAAAVSASDSADLPNPALGILVGTAGDVKVDMLNGTTVTLKNVAAGIIHRIAVRRIYSTGTTAVNIVALF